MASIGTGYCQVVRSAGEDRAYEFVQSYFEAKASLPDQPPYRLKVAFLPVISPYFQNFDLRKTLNNKYLDENQFIVTAITDSLLTEVDFEHMRWQMTAWQTIGKWRAGALRARGVRVLVRDRRTELEHLTPKFTTYQVFPPLFSVDGRTALFYVENYCGLDCAGGQISVLRRQRNGTWKWLLSVMTFVA